MKVFISYSWQDVPIRRAIVAELKSQRGVDVLYDYNGISASDSIHSTISAFIDSSDLVVCILTPAGLGSNEVQDELVRANERKKKILPLVEKSISLDQLPHFLNDVLQIRFTNDEFDEAVENLCGTIGKFSSSLSPDQQEEKRSLHSKIVPSTVRDFVSPDLDWLQRSNLGRELLEQVIAMCAVFPFNWKNELKDKVTPIFIAPNTFIPDSWTRSFLTGILKAESIDSSETIVEIGVGTGIVPIVLAKSGFGYSKYYGFDIDTLATRVGSINSSFYSLSNRVVFKGGGSIFEPERAFEIHEEYADLILANVPQVPSMSTGPIRDLFDYYPVPYGSMGRKREWAMQGLWLVSEILEQSSKRLTKDGKIVLNIGGRPGKEHILDMFSHCGYKTKIVHSEIIEQDPETDISALVHFETTQKVEYSFYSDEDCQARIPARYAYNLISEGHKAYHKLYVIEAQKIS